MDCTDPCIEGVVQTVSTSVSVESMDRGDVGAAMLQQVLEWCGGFRAGNMAHMRRRNRGVCLRTVRIARERMHTPKIGGARFARVTERGRTFSQRREMIGQENIYDERGQLVWEWTEERCKAV